MPDATANAKVGHRQWIGLRALPTAEPEPTDAASPARELAPAAAQANAGRPGYSPAVQPRR